jgi:hypothetical protein
MEFNSPCSVCPVYKHQHKIETITKGKHKLVLMLDYLRAMPLRHMERGRIAAPPFILALDGGGCLASHIFRLIPGAEPLTPTG